MVDGSIWTHWHGHIEVLVGLSLLEAAYLLGVGPLRERYGWADDIDPRRIATFTLGVLVIFFSLVSPLHVLSDDYLFSAHMLQHMLLTLAAPPLLILGTPDWLIHPLLRPNWSFRAVRMVTRPVPAVFVFNVVFALWHVPTLYNASTSFHVVHIFEHLLFIGTALIMWWPLMSRMPELPRLAEPLQIVYLFSLSISQIMVFGFITFSQIPLYEHYAHAADFWGMSQMADQQIGGVLMKVGSSAVFIVLLLIVFLRWYNREEARDRAELEKISKAHDDDQGGTLVTV